MKISQKIPMVIFLLIFSSFSLFSWFQYHTVTSALYQKNEVRIQQAAVDLSNQISNWLNSKLLIIDLAADAIAQDFSQQKVQNIINLETLSQEFILVFGGLETDGAPIANDPQWNFPADWDARRRPWYQLARRNNQSVLTEPYHDSATGELLVSVVAKVSDNTSFRGAFGGDLSLKKISDTINSQDYDQAGYAFLLSEDGNIISHPDASLNGKNYQSVFDNKRPALVHEAREYQVEGQSLFVTFRPLNNIANWYVAIVFDKEKILKDAYQLSYNTILASLFTALISSLILYFVINKLLVAPIGRLTDITDEISRGKLDSEILEASRQDEIGDLAKAIKRMSASLKITLNRLRKR